MYGPKPISVTRVTADNYDGKYAPAPMLIVGDGVEVVPQTAPPVDSSPADAAAVAADLQALVDKLVDAGVLTA